MYNRYMKDQHFWLLSVVLLGLTIGLILVFLLAGPVITPVSGVVLSDKLEPLKYEARKIEIVEKQEPLKFLFVGDIMLDRNVGKVIEKEGFGYLFSTLPEDFFDGYNLVSANLESAVTENGEHYVPHNKYDFAISPERLEKLTDVGFNFFTIANNHIADQGQNGIEETREFLDLSEIDYVGCNDKEVGDCSVKIVEIEDRKIGMLGFSMVYGLFNQEKALEMIAELASSTDLVIINIHWGVEYAHYKNKIQENLAHKIIDAGADVIIGHHPHVVQGMEVYKSKLIFYSLGNFIFDQYFSDATQEGLGVELVFSEDEISFNLLPFVSKKSQPSLKNSENKVKFLERFVAWSSINDKLKNDLLKVEFNESE